MASEVENYLAKMQVYQGAYVRANQLVSQARRCVAALQDWRLTIITNTDSAYPSDLRRIDNQMMNAKEWPSVKDIDAALVAYHDAKENMKMAYDSLSSSVMAAIKTPAVYIAEVEKDLENKYSR